MLYLIIGLAVILAWVVLKRVIIVGVLLSMACAAYFFSNNQYSLSNLPGPLGGALKFANINNIGQVKNLVDQEAKTVLSFYSGLSNNQGDLISYLAQVSNGGGAN